MRKKGTVSEESFNKISGAFSVITNELEKLNNEELLGLAKTVAQYSLMYTNVYCSYSESNYGATLILTGKLAEHVKKYVDSIDHETIAGAKEEDTSNVI